MSDYEAMRYSAARLQEHATTPAESLLAGHTLAITTLQETVHELVELAGMLTARILELQER